VTYTDCDDTSAIGLRTITICSQR